jgi:Kdo2-lipid IVA lauroyltransferase/acyltransferase
MGRLEDGLFSGYGGQDWPVENFNVRGDRTGFSAWVEYYLLRGVQRVLLWSPRPVRRMCTAGLARLAYLFDKRHTESARKFIKVAFPDLSADEVEARVMGAWKHALRLLTEVEGMSRLLDKPIGDHFKLTLCAEARAVLDAGQGCLVVTAHVGHWEAGGVLSSLGFRPFYGVGKPPRNAPLGDHIQRMREGQGLRMLSRKGAMKGIPSVLRAGGTVAMLLDQRARVKPVVAPFFGRPAFCDRTIGVLARRLDVPVLFFAVYMTPEPFQYELVMPCVLQPADFVGLKPEQVAARINSELEELILAHPEQYFWLHDRYAGAPDTTDNESSEVSHSTPEARGAKI